MSGRPTECSGSPGRRAGPCACRGSRRRRGSRSSDGEPSRCRRGVPGGICTEISQGTPGEAQLPGVVADGREACAHALRAARRARTRSRAAATRGGQGPHAAAGRRCPRQPGVRPPAAAPTLPGSGARCSPAGPRAGHLRCSGDHRTRTGRAAQCPRRRHRVVGGEQEHLAAPASSRDRATQEVGNLGRQGRLVTMFVHEARTGRREDLVEGLDRVLDVTRVTRQASNHSRGCNTCNCAGRVGAVKVAAYLPRFGEDVAMLRVLRRRRRSTVRASSEAAADCSAGLSMTVRPVRPRTRMRSPLAARCRYSSRRLWSCAGSIVVAI